MGASHRFTVEVSKEGLPRSLLFHCGTDGEELDVEQVSLVDEDLEDEESGVEDPYEGPKFETLDQDLQANLYSFLWSRGVDKDFVGHVFASVVDKEQQEYVRWLAGVEGFIQGKK